MQPFDDTRSYVDVSYVLIGGSVANEDSIKMVVVELCPSFASLPNTHTRSEYPELFKVRLSAKPTLEWCHIHYSMNLSVVQACSM
jgi:hypothetical protein